MRLWISIGLFFTLSCGELGLNSSREGDDQSLLDLSETSRAHSGIGIPFTENRGQWSREVAFKANIVGGTLWITRDGKLVHSLLGEKKWNVVETFVEGSPKFPKGIHQTVTHVSYFIGSDASKHAPKVKTYETVSLGEVWDGVQVVLHSQTKTVEKYFHVLPGASPDVIKMKLEGGKKLGISDTGELKVATGVGEVTLSRPVAYQLDANGSRKAVDVAYVLEKDVYGFDVGEYDEARELVIDPILQSTSLGGSGNDAMLGLKENAAGEFVVWGTTASSDFPGTVGGAQESHHGGNDIFISRISRDLGTLHQSTTFGGMGDEYAPKMLMDTTGHLYVAGQTKSRDLPLTANGIHEQSAGSSVSSDDDEVFVSKFSASLDVLEQSTYLGGSSADSLASFLFAADGSLYVVGTTMSLDFPVSPDAVQTTTAHMPGRIYDRTVFVSKMDPSLRSMHQSTYLGSRDGTQQGEDRQLTTMLDDDGTLIIAGSTHSNDFPTTAGVIQTSRSAFGYPGYLTRFSADLRTIIASTYLGGDEAMYFAGATKNQVGEVYMYGRSFDDRGILWRINPEFSIMLNTQEIPNAVPQLMAIDAEQSIYVMGRTRSTTLPNVAGGAQELIGGTTSLFFSKLSEDLQTIHQSTYFGGNGFMSGQFSIEEGYLLLIGSTGISNLLGKAHGAQNRLNGNTDVFVSKIALDLRSVIQSTYLGGSSDDGFAGAITEGGDGVLVFGTTDSENFPTSVNAYQRTIVDGDGFITRISSDLRSCGNAIKEGDDECDGADLGTEVCAGLVGPGAVGTPGCDSECRYTTATCGFNLTVQKSPEAGCVVSGALDVDGSTRFTVGVVPYSDSVDATLNATAPTGFKLGPVGGHVCGEAVCTSERDCAFNLGAMDREKACTIECNKACGDGVIDAGESCDGSALGKGSCQAEGFAGGMLLCDASCALDTLGCFHELTVVKRGEQAMDQRVTPVAGSAIDCGETCTQRFMRRVGPNIVLTANPRELFSVAWEGCSKVVQRQCIMDVGWTGSKTVTVTYAKPDTDADGLFDLEECPALASGDATVRCLDPDGDGQPVHMDDDDDDDGILTKDEVADARALNRNDFDGDTQFNWLDPDSDEDGVFDGVEGRVDVNSNGKLDYLDTSHPGPKATAKGCCTTQGRGTSSSWGLGFIAALIMLMRVKRFNWAALMLMLGCSNVAEPQTDSTSAWLQDAHDDAHQEVSKHSGFFVENRGQWSREVRHRIDTTYGALWITNEGALVHAREDWSVVERLHTGKPVRVKQQRALETQVSYFVGDSTKHASKIPTFQSLLMSQVWEGIDVELLAKRDGVEKVFRVMPGIDPTAIRVEIEGAKKLHVSDQGELVIATGTTEMILSQPWAYQYSEDGKKVPVAVEYALKGDNYGFKLGEYDHAKELFIDPILQSTFLGGAAEDTIMSVQMLSNHDLLIAGRTRSMDFPTLPGGAQLTRTDADDAFIAIMDASLTELKHMTYLGGPDTLSSSFFVEIADHAMEHPVTGDIYVTGRTNSGRFPRGEAGGTLSCLSPEIFISRLSPDLSILHQSICVGGNTNEYVSGITTRPGDGAIVIAGNTASSDFPVTIGVIQSTQPARGTRDGYVTIVDASLNGILQSTYLGGARTDAIYAPPLFDDTGNLWVGGYTESVDFPMTALGAQEDKKGFGNIFVSKLEPDLSEILQSTYLGGDGGGWTFQEGSMGFDSQGNLLITGRTSAAVLSSASTQLGATNGTFLASIHPSLRSFNRMDYLPSPVASVLIDQDGQYTFVGSTTSESFPGKFGGAQSTFGGNQDVVLYKTDANLSHIIQSTYYGGSGLDSARGAILDSEGKVVIVGSSDSTDLLYTAQGFQDANHGNTDGFIAKISPDLGSCGNGIKEGDDACDGEDVGGEICARVVGPTAIGSLSCDSECNHVTSACAFRLQVNKAPVAGCIVTGAVNVNGENRFNVGTVAYNTQPVGLHATAPSGYKLGTEHNCGVATCPTDTECDFDLGVMDREKSCTISCVEACGDGVVDTAEDCDGSNTNGAGCGSLGFAGGTLGCSACAFNASACFHRLTIEKQGEGAEGTTVTSIAGSNIECGGRCSQSYMEPVGPNIVLNANAPQFTLSLWEGCSSVRSRFCVLDEGWTGDKTIRVTYSKPDTDGDGLYDLEECPGLSDANSTMRCGDPDGDGLVNVEDSDDDDDGLPTREEVMDARMLGYTDHDADGQLNWLDPDSDDDGVFDGLEGRVDQNGNGKLDYLDRSYPVKSGKSTGCCTAVGQKRTPGATGLFALLAMIVFIRTSRS